ncbi:MAG: response regulator transcription factor [Oligosphaeraceae bacterium]|nr:response regulator transcription factor [Oligosphaeraceae bacterium]
MRHKVLIAEDEPAIRELVRLALEEANITEIIEASNGKEALEKAERYQPSLILLDWMMPEMDGLTVCRTLKMQESTRNIPIVMLTAKSEEGDIVLGLEMGAVDYITKPFSRRVLIARVRAHLREQSETTIANEIRRGSLMLNIEQHLCKLNGEPVELTFSEYEILALFARHPGRVYTRNQIIRRVKGDDYPVTERSVDVQIVNLRKKLGEWGSSNIETIRGIGYRLKQENWQ